MVMNSFTDDLWTEILLRLPIKSLLRFKSVSKSWLSIISSHRFAISHLATTFKDDKILIAHHESGDYQVDDGSFSLFHLDSGRIFKNLKFPYSQGEYPFHPKLSSQLIGSDCGIVCVSVEVYKWRAVKKHFNLYLWNPATKHSKLLPPHTILDGDKSVTVGFGFDEIDLDFKVVRVVSSTLSAEVYSSNYNSWRKIQSKPISFPYSGRFHAFHGFLFAIGTNSDMMAFNLNREVFICDISLPVFSDAESDIQTCITDFKDTIAVTIFSIGERNINLWTLDDEARVCSGEVKASWTKVLSIDDVGVFLDFVEGLFNNVQFLLFGRYVNRWFLYDWNKKVTTDVPFRPYLECGEFFKYTKSLFSLVGFKPVKWASSPRLEDSLDWDVQMDE